MLVPDRFGSRAPFVWLAPVGHDFSVFNHTFDTEIGQNHVVLNPLIGFFKISRRVIGR